MKFLKEQGRSRRRLQPADILARQYSRKGDIALLGGFSLLILNDHISEYLCLQQNDVGLGFGTH